MCTHTARSLKHPRAYLRLKLKPILRLAVSEEGVPSSCLHIFFVALLDFIHKDKVCSEVEGPDMLKLLL